MELIELTLVTVHHFIIAGSKQPIKNTDIIPPKNKKLNQIKKKI